MIKLKSPFPLNDYTLHNGDCLDVMRAMPDGSVDAIITDLPYGTTACKWDEVIPFAPMWEQVKRVLKPRGVFVTTASQPFTSALISSNMEWFKYEWVWVKAISSGFLHAKNAPLKLHENIVVFSGGTIGHMGKVVNRMNYYPQMSAGKPYKMAKNPDVRFKWGNIARPSTNHIHIAENEGTRYPVSVLNYKNPNHSNVHPTQKPVALYEYLIRTYTNEGDTVLDMTMGSGTTGVAAMQAGRKFVGIELSEDYFKVAEKRIANAAAQPALVTAMVEIGENN